MKITEVVAALIWNGDKFMICQRPANKARGLLWEFVGGKVEPGETKEQALIRECKEELAVTLSVGDVFMDDIHKYITYRQRDGKLFSALAYQCLFFCFSWLDLAANKLPEEPSRLMCRALADHEFFALPDKGGYYFGHIRLSPSV